MSSQLADVVKVLQQRHFVCEPYTQALSAAEELRQVGISESCNGRQVDFCVDGGIVWERKACGSKAGAGSEDLFRLAQEASGGVHFVNPGRSCAVRLDVRRIVRCMELSATGSQWFCLRVA